MYKYRAGAPHSLPDNYIQSRIIEDEEGNLWFTTNEALNCYVRKHDYFESYRDSIDGQPRTGYHLAFITNDGELGVVVDGKDFKFFNLNTKEWKRKQLFPSTMYRVIPIYGKNDNLTGIVTGNYDQAGIHFFDFEPPDTSVYHVRFSGENGEPALRLNDGLWLGDTLLLAAKEGLLTYPKNGENWSFWPTPDWYPNKISLVKGGDIMVSTDGGGWLKLDRNNPSFSKQYLSDPSDRLSLSSNTTYGVWEDNDGGLWTGTVGIGVDFTYPNKLKFNVLDIGAKFGIGSRPVGVHAMAEDGEGNIWCSTRGTGLFVLSPSLEPLAHFRKRNNNGFSIPGDDVHYIFFDERERCWAATYTSLFMLPPNGKRFETVSTNGILHGIELARGKGLLFSTFDGGISLLREREDGFLLEKITTVDTLNPFTHLFQNRKGHVLANKNLQTILVLDSDHDFAIVDEWPIKGDVHTYYEEPGSDTIWIGTKNGLSCLDQKDPSAITTFTEDDGLPDQEIYAIIGDDSTLWLTTNRGMVRFFKKEKRFHVYDLYDGMQGFEFNSNGFLERRNGEVWLAGQKGINYFIPSEVHPLGISPKVQIIGIWVNDERRQDLVCTKTSATSVSEIVELVFQPEERKFRFEFAALEFSNPARNTFRYKLEGYDDKWSQWSSDNFAIYHKLPSGDYTLVVSATNADGFESEEWKRLAFTIKTPFWQQWWFIILAIFTLLAIGYAIYRYRLAQLLHIERLRNQISTDLHDDIGATLSNVNILTTLVRQKLPSNSDALPLLDRIEEEVSASAESLDDIIWSINPKNDPLDRVLARMRRFASEVFEAKGIDGSLHFPKEAKHLRLDMGKRRQFYLLFKEAVNNLAKYAECKTADITVIYQNGNLNLTVKDDGMGFDPMAKEDSGNGLSTMRQRAANLKGKLKIQSTVGMGTSVNVVFPITEIRE